MRVRKTSLTGLGILIGILASAGRSAAVPFNEIPAAMGDILGIPTTMAQMIMACGVLFMVLVPLAMLKMKPQPMAAICILVIACLVGVGWLPLWTLLIIAMMAAGLFASFMKRSIGG